MKMIRLMGKLLQPVEYKMINSFNAKRTGYATNYIDKALYSYDVGGKQVDILVEENTFDDETTLISEDGELLQRIFTDLMKDYEKEFDKKD